MSSRLTALALCACSFLAACGSSPVEDEATAASSLEGTEAPVGPAGEQDAPPMRKLDFLAGNWRGTGSIQLGPGAAHAFVQTETVERRLDGVVLTIEGLGTEANGAVVHNAFAVLFHDDRGYHMRAFTADGRTTESDAVVGEGTLAWGYRAGPQTVRFSIRVTPQGQWIENGESSSDGVTWRPFFEMTLDRSTR